MLFCLFEETKLAFITNSCFSFKTMSALYGSFIIYTALTQAVAINSPKIVSQIKNTTFSQLVCRHCLPSRIHVSVISTIETQASLRTRTKLCPTVPTQTITFIPQSTNCSVWIHFLVQHNCTTLS